MEIAVKTTSLSSIALLATWMSQEVSKRLVNGLYITTYKWGIPWGYIPLILTIDPNFLGHPSNQRVDLFQKNWSGRSWFLRPPMSRSGSSCQLMNTHWLDLIYKMEFPLGPSYKWSLSPLYMTLHPGRLTWNIIMEVWKIIFISK